MNRKNLFLAVGISLLSFLLVSCGGDDDAIGSVVSRNVKYEITGNFTGALSATYITASGGGTVESITLPWTKEITYHASATTAGLSLVGAGGVSGQVITVKVYVGGKEKSATPGTATANGTIAISAPSYIF